MIHNLKWNIHCLYDLLYVHWLFSNVSTTICVTMYQDNVSGYLSSYYIY
jgi:hypothetical protein